MAILQRRAVRGMMFGVAVLLASAVAQGVHPQNWTHQSEHDYVDGSFDNTVVNGFGELTLGRELKSISNEGAVDFVNAFAQGKDGVVYFSTSPQGKVFKVVEGKATEYFTAPESNDQIIAMTVDGEGKVVIAACGETAKLMRLTPNGKGKATAKTIFEDEKIQYVWSIKNGADGAFYLGTGPEGKVVKVGADGKSTVVAETGAKNVISLMQDGKGNWIAGTDAEGMVIRIDKETGKAFVLLDAGNVDISALALDEAGNIYVATATPDSGGDSEEGGGVGSKSKPGTVEPEMNDTEPSMDGDTGEKAAPKKPAGGAGKGALKGEGRVFLPDGAILAQTASSLPPDIKAVLEKMKAAAAKHEAAGKKGKSKMLGAGTKKAEGLGKKVGHSPTVETGDEEGNAVYRISPEGVVTTLLRSSDMMVSLLYHKGELLIGTGAEGKVYSYKTEGEEEALVARVRSENVMSLFEAADGTVYFGTSNSGQVYTLGASNATKGTYMSGVLDAEHTANWGMATLMAGVPEGTKASLATRTGNVKDVEKHGNFWSEWSAEIGPAEGEKVNAGGKGIASPAARFLQYRVTLTGNGKGATPTVQQVRLAYQVENLAPKIKNLAAEVDSSSPDDLDLSKDSDTTPSHTVHVTWDASDPNKDELTYRVLYREVGTEVWVQAAKEVKDTTYTWNTRAVPDGKYQIKVIASDAADNTAGEAKSVAQVSAPVVIDNTPPTIAEMKNVVEGGKVSVSGTAKDGLSAISEVRYQVDSAQDWQPATASDKIFDSPSEGFTFVTRALLPGNHRVSVRATDSQGNNCYQAFTVTVK